MKKVFIDLETTGIDWYNYGVHQISGLIEIDGKIKEKFNIKVKPFKDKKISRKSLDVCGISIEDLKQYLPTKEGFNQLVLILSKYIDITDRKDRFFFIAYNSYFDYSFLRQLFIDNQSKMFYKLFFANHIDVMAIAGEFLMSIRKELPNFKLLTVFKILQQLKLTKYKINENKANDALFDVILAKIIFDVCTDFENRKLIK